MQEVDVFKDCRTFGELGCHSVDGAPFEVKDELSLFWVLDPEGILHQKEVYFASILHLH